MKDFCPQQETLYYDKKKHIFLSQVGSSLACRFYRTFLRRKRDPFPRETH